MVKLQCEIPVKCPAEKFWRGIKNSKTVYPKVFPERVKSIEVVEGDGTSAGTVWLFKYVDGTPSVTFCKEKVEVLDDANKILAYSVIEGEVTNVYKSLMFSFQVVPNGEGSLVKWSAEFEKANEGIRADPKANGGIRADPNHLREHAAEGIARIDDYLFGT